MFEDLCEAAIGPLQALGVEEVSTWWHHLRSKLEKELPSVISRVKYSGTMYPFLQHSIACYPHLRLAVLLF